MAENKLSFAEGPSIHRPPMFSDISFHFWKLRMQIFVESIDKGIWDALVNGPYIPKCLVENKQVDKPWTE